jgi:uncharacterized protein (TIGR03067 family)
MRLWTVLVAVVAFCLVSVARADKASDDEMKKIAGNYVAVSQEKDGAPVTTKDVDAPTLNLKPDGKYQYQNGDQKHQGTYQCTPSQNPAQKPSQIDLTPDDKTQKPVQCIYQQQDNGKLQVCIPSPGQQRPTQFQTKPNSGQTTITYQPKK